MKLATILLAAATLGAADINRLTPAEKKEGFVLLFDGKTLDGWDGDRAVWWAEDGSIVGSSDRQAIKLNTFLIHKDPVADFVLRFQVKLRNNNSGVQFRSVVLPGPGWIVSGYQADLSEAGDRSAWGNFYEERGRSRTMMKTPGEGWERAKSVVRKGDWNDYEVMAQGNRFRLTLNGTVTIDQTDDKTASGVLALQLHNGEPMRVEYRTLRIRRLK